MKAIREKLIPSIIVSILLGSLGLGLRFLGISTEWSLILAGTILVTTFAIMLMVYRPLRRKVILWFTEAEIAENGQDNSFLNFKSQLIKKIGIASKDQIEENSGVVGWFPSFREAETEIANKVLSSKEIRILTNNGKSDISKGTHLYDAIISNQQVKIRVLLASPNSYFVSEDWAIKNKYSKEQSNTWIKRIENTIEEINYISDKHNIDIDYRLYEFPFVWHIWIIDEIVFVSAWLERTKNISATKVIKIKRDENANGKNLYNMFNTFFNRMWEEYSHPNKSNKKFGG